jgi:hypothetical protein
MFKAIIQHFRNRGEFPERIRKRHETFWKDPNAQKVSNSIMSKEDTLDKWQDAPHWQRRLSNKYNARLFAEMNGCQVPDLYWKGADVDSIEFDKLPEHYVIRPTSGHSSNLVFLMARGTNLFDYRNYSPEDIRILLKTAIAERPTQQFLVEEFLQNEDGVYTIPNDYKFLCFNGEIASIVVIKRLGPKKGLSYFYDEHWNKMNKMHYLYPGNGEQQPPKCFNEMLAQAKRLSKAYGIFVRLDFYATPKGPVFGEFTPTPGLGSNFTPYGKKVLLNYWDKYCKGCI